MFFTPWNTTRNTLGGCTNTYIMRYVCVVAYLGWVAVPMEQVAAQTDLGSTDIGGVTAVIISDGNGLVAVMRNSADGEGSGSNGEGSRRDWR